MKQNSCVLTLRQRSTPHDLEILFEIFTSEFYILLHLPHYVEQGSQARGPPNTYMRPANISKIDNIINFDQI